MKPDLRISVKDYRRNQNLKVQLRQVPFATARQYWVRMNGQPWPKQGQPVSLTRVMTALRKSLVKTSHTGTELAAQGSLDWRAHSGSARGRVTVYLLALRGGDLS